jgi:outer membrane lipoprotein-sorting protein
MNNLRHPCEAWAELVSLAAAGCLSPDEERDVRQHIETCADCRERFGQLIALCGALSEVRLPADRVATAIIERAMTAVASEQSARPIVSSRAEVIHARLFSRSLNTWRWIMRSPVSRVAAAVIFALAIAGVALWFHGSGAAPSFADFVKPILTAKSAKFKLEYEAEGQPAQKMQVTFLAPNRLRQDLPSGFVNISDFDKGKMVGLDPKNKRMTVFSLANMPKDKLPANFFSQLQSQVLDAEKSADAKRESLGEKEIAGRRAVGYRISSTAQVLTIWGDPQTGLPVRIESKIDLIPKVKTTWTEFEFDVPVDPSLFRLEPPPGYTVVDVPVDVSPPVESDLIASLRQYAEMNDGRFPDAFDTPSTMVFVQKLVKKLGLKLEGEPGPELQREMMAAIFKLNRGFMFALQMPKEAESHYAGKGVSLGAADKPIFWYRPKDAKKYRVIFGDLTARDADAAPNVPKEQAVPVQANPKK